LSVTEEAECVSKTNQRVEKLLHALVRPLLRG
jgi:hypothetical protein